MKLLLIDTCGPTGSVALADAGSTPAALASLTLPGRTASERLVPSIRQLAGADLHSLGAIAVVHGPGSFTGVRVGLSAAKGLCEALNLPLIAISRLAVLAHLADTPPGAVVCALFDAGRGEFYEGTYRDGIRLRESLLTRAQVLAEYELSAASIVTCEPAVAQAVAELAPRLIAEPTAADALPLATRRIQLQEFDDPLTLDANYLRRTDAEMFAKPTAGGSPTR